MPGRTCLLVAPLFVALCLPTSPAAAQVRNQLPRRPQQPAGRGPQQAPAGQAAQQAPRGAAAPFQLSQREFDDLVAVLKTWEVESGKVNTLSCELTEFRFDAAFRTKTTHTGEIKYEKPDKGLYRVKDAKRENWDQHWVCDGKSLFQYNFSASTLVERTLPKELQGTAIADGPLPFLFGVEANKLLRRYFMRLLTPPPELRGKQYWVEAYPRFQRDAAAFQRAIVILQREPSSKLLLPQAIKLYDPTIAANGAAQNYTVHRFDNIKINAWRFFPRNDFAAPLPRGWKKIVNPEQAQAAAQKGGGTIPPRTGAVPPRGPSRSGVFGPQPRR